MRAALASVLSRATAVVAAVVTGLTPAARATPSARAQSSVDPAVLAAAPANPHDTDYALPVDPPTRVLAPFAPPRTAYAVGHRGVDLAVARRGRVLAAAAGVVRFAGQVAGRGVVVVLHADGIATEYEPVRPLVRVGVRLARGTPIGTVLGRHRTCPRDACVHWSARRGSTYLDPMALLDALGAVRLIPWMRAP